ncbi:Ig-like domain-containing protein [Maribacter sp. 2210JD10-5]|uniref:Ig-like domain-containing protein n=1 Tax=Maribacter sp. 2210JD10-5 TaxID=3386272 RepID=UPI0039BD02FA
MKLDLPNFFTMVYLCFFLTIFSSCSKDSDLLTDYVINDSETISGISRYVVDDTYYVNFNNSMVLDVLENDSFPNNSEVIITETSDPNNGTVVINADNTLTYTPGENSEEETEGDTFTYTAEETTEEGEVVVEEGSVTLADLDKKLPTSGDNIYYATVSGRASSDGKTEETAWDLVHAFKTAKAGDIVHVKAGEYKDLKIFTSRSGTSNSPIKFIGYKNKPGDVVSTIFSTYTKNDFDQDNSVLKGDSMPLLTNNRGSNKDPDPEDRAFNIDHSFIHIENFMTQYYDYGYDIDTRTTGNVLINFVANEMGNWNPSNSGWNQSFALPDSQGGNLSGFGIRAKSSENLLVKNVITFNAGHANVDFISCNNVVYENAKCYATKRGNSTDYMTIFYGTSNSKVKNYEAYRVSGLPHANRALVLICNSSNNVIEDVYTENLRMVVHINSNNNIFRNITSQGSGNPFEAEFSISTNSNNNIIYNFKADNSGGINFRGGDNQCGGSKSTGTGNNNFFINPVITNVIPWHEAAIDFGFQSAGNGSAGKNYIIGGTFDNAPNLIKVDRPNEMLFLVNCTFSNISKGFMGSRDNEGFVPKVTYDHVNFYNIPFSLPSGTSITSLNPNFNDDKSLKNSSGLVDKGTDATKYFKDSKLDFNGIVRGKGDGWDIGAFEH